MGDFSIPIYVIVLLLGVFIAPGWAPIVIGFLAGRDLTGVTIEFAMKLGLITGLIVWGLMVWAIVTWDDLPFWAYLTTWAVALAISMFITRAICWRMHLIVLRKNVAPE